MRTRILFVLALLPLLFEARAGVFALPGGPLPSNVAETAAVLRQEPYDLELLISFGTSRGGSAGHLALALRDAAPDRELVYSANFYADRAAEHAKDFYTDELMVRIPKMEYLYGTASSLGPKAAFGLDFGEVYKRSVVGVRVRGVPAAEKQALAAYFARINDDFRKRARDTEYHNGEVRYDYMHLNCAKTIAVAFKYGAGYKDLPIKGTVLLPAVTTVVAALHANIPTEMAMKLVKEWNSRGYGMDVVLYRKYEGSTYVDPHDDAKVAFKDLPNRFPSVMSRDFRNDEKHYEDYDNLLAMYLFFNMGRYLVEVDGVQQRLAIGRARSPLPYPEALGRAERDAKADSGGFLSRIPFVPSGSRVGASLELESDPAR